MEIEIISTKTLTVVEVLDFLRLDFVQLIMHLLPSITFLRKTTHDKEKKTQRSFTVGNKNKQEAGFDSAYLTELEG